MKSRSLQFFSILVLIVVLAIPRLIGIDRFATIDEPYWLTAGSDFYYALGQRAFANTVYDYHPAVTTMWIIAAAMLAYFPQYRGFGQGYFDVYKDTLEQFLLSHGHTPLGLLTTGRIIQTAVIVFLLLVTFWFLRRLLGEVIAWGGVLMISFDPFFLGHSRLLNHEGILSLFVMVSLLASLIYLFTERKLKYLLISGAAAGFAQLTKSSASVLIPVIGLLFLLDLFSQQEWSWKKRLLTTAAELAGWFLMLCAIYFIFWPGMWVAPDEMLYQVFGNALSYAFQGSRLSVTGGVQPAQFNPHFSDLFGFIYDIQWRTTPIIWIGAVLGIKALYQQKKAGRFTLVSVFLTGILFILLFAIAGGRNSAHYVLTAYVSLDIIAAAGWYHAAEWVARHAGERFRVAIPPWVLAIAVVLQGYSIVAFFPYYYTYYNPILEWEQPGRQNMNFGYGEGLDLAAAYLSKQPGAGNSTVIAFYGRGPFSYFYPGKTDQLKTVYADRENVPQLIQILHESKYIVIYYELEQGRDTPANVMRALETAKPDKTIWLNDIEYVRIYRADDLPPRFYELLQQ